MKKVKFYATRDFKDAGLEAVYSQGEAYEIEEGHFLNYAAAGLASKNKPAAEPTPAPAPAA